MKKILLFLISFLIFPFSTFSSEIVVSNWIIKKIVEEIIKEEKIYSLQSEKQEFHTFVPTISQWKKIKSAELVIIVGTEPWAKRVYNLRKDKLILDLSQGQTKFLDPHLWFDLERVKKLIKNLIEYLATVYPERKEIYQQRYEKFLKELENIEKEYKDLKYCKYKEIFILGHPVFGYLLKDSGVKQITLIKSYHKGGEPSIKMLTEIMEKLNLRKNKIVFLTDPDCERFKNLFEEKGIKVIKLWSGGSYYFEGSYLELLKYNLENIRKSLECKN